MSDIKIYLSCHKNMVFPKHPYLYPIQVGTALAKDRFPNMLADNIGSNISEKNPFYCELTAQYWVWKNQQADYYGFFHYRRFLSFQPNQKRICWVYPQITEAVLQRHGYDAIQMEQLIDQYDLLMPCGEQTAETVYQKYVNANAHYKEDLELVLALLRQYTPEYQQAAEYYLHGYTQYYYNMYIMRQKLFRAYCEWLFPLLERFDQSNNWEKYTTENALRVDGYLAERLFGIWYTYQKNKISALELPYLYFTQTGGRQYYQQWLRNAMFPAGSKRKIIMKKLCQKIGALKK